MIKWFLDFTDRFIYTQIKRSFDRTERHFKAQNRGVDLSMELEKLRENPLGCMIGNRDRFETVVKIKIKAIMGFFFVAVPLLTFGTVSLLRDINLTFAVYGTLLIAFLAASRTETLAERYVRGRMAQTA